MSRTARTSVVALAAALVAVAVVVWLSRSQHRPEAAASASTSPTSAASPSTPSPLPGTGGDPARVDGGTYLVSDPFPVSLTVAVPAGWWTELPGSYAAFVDSSDTDGGAELALSLDPSVFATPCIGGIPLQPQPGPTVDDLASALASLPTFATKGPSAVTVDGIKGEQVTLTAPSKVRSCQPTSYGFQTWTLPLGHVFALEPGATMTVRIVKVGGQRLIISSQSSPETPVADTKADAAMLASLHFIDQH